MFLAPQEDVKRFDSLLQEVTGSPILHIDLKEAWRYCFKHPEGGRVLAHIIDLQMHVAALQTETRALAEVMGADLWVIVSA